MSLSKQAIHDQYSALIREAMQGPGETNPFTDEYDAWVEKTLRRLRPKFQALEAQCAASSGHFFQHSEDCCSICGYDKEEPQKVLSANLLKS